MRTRPASAAGADELLDGLGGPPFLSVRDLRKSYGPRHALNGISFAVAAGECLGLLGPNGAGKTTTILAVCGLLEADSGSVRVGPDAEPPTSATARRHIGYVPQEIALYEDLTARENLRFFGRLHGLARRDLAERVEEVLAFVELAARGDDRVATYSGGMQRRLNIAVALLHRPGLIVLDEPTVGIDPQSRNAILENLAALREDGAAIVYASHYMEEVERLCDRVAVMDEGRVLADSTTGGLLDVLGAEPCSVRLSLRSVLSGRALAELRAVPDVLSAEHEGETLVLAVHAVAPALAAVLAVLAKRRVVVEGLMVDRPTLESVFLRLTGKALRDD